jgi:putative membrane protein
MMGWGAGGWVFMGVGMVLFWALVIFGIVWIVRALSERDRGPERGAAARDETPLETLDRSLAEGRVDVDDYEKRRRVLTGST